MFPYDDEGVIVMDILEFNYEQEATNYTAVLLSNDTIQVIEISGH